MYYSCPCCKCNFKNSEISYLEEEGCGIIILEQNLLPKENRFNPKLRYNSIVNK